MIHICAYKHITIISFSPPHIVLISSSHLPSSSPLLISPPHLPLAVSGLRPLSCGCGVATPPLTHLHPPAPPARVGWGRGVPTHPLIAQDALRTAHAVWARARGAHNTTSAADGVDKGEGENTKEEGKERSDSEADGRREASVKKDDTNGKNNVTNIVGILFRLVHSSFRSSIR